MTTLVRASSLLGLSPAVPAAPLLQCFVRRERTKGTLSRAPPSGFSKLPARLLTAALRSFVKA